MSEVTQRLRKLQKSFSEIKAQKQPPPAVWQVVHKNSDFFQSIKDFDPVDFHRRSVKESLPDNETILSKLINTGKIFLLGGILRLIIVPDGMDLDKVEVLMFALQRKYPNNNTAVYNKAVEILFKERNNG